MVKLTYLFGAGASRNAIPIVSELPKELFDFRNSLSSGVVDQKYAAAKESLIKQIDDILKALEHNTSSFDPDCPSIDQYAKELWQIGDIEGFRNIKRVLALFFIFKQSKKEIDQRYRTFYSRILSQHALKIPESIKIISWNYDSQFELAYRHFSKIDDPFTNKDKIGILAKHLFPRLSYGPAWMPTASGTSIFKVNGTATIYHTGTGQEERNDVFSNIFDDVCDKFMRCSVSHESALSFAWEDEEHEAGYEGILPLVKEAIKDSDILVILGYSIPFYNKTIDYEILQSMEKLNKVYIQDPNADSVKSNFSRICSVQNISIIPNTEQFEVPIEYTTQRLS